MSYRLQVVTPDGRQQEYPLQQELSLGSSDQNHIVVHDANIAAQHVIFGVDGGNHWFRTTEESGGITLNGAPASEGWLQGNEEIQVGSTTIRLLPPAQEAADELPAPPALDFDMPSMDQPMGGSPMGGSPMGGGGGLEIDLPPELMGDFKDPSEDLEAAGAFLDQGFSSMPADAQTHKRPRSNLWFVILLGVYGGSAAMFCLGLFFVWQLFFLTQDIPEQREATMVKAFETSLKGRKYLLASQWRNASQSLREASMQTPKKSPLRDALKDLVDKATNEWVALSAFQQAKAAYAQKRGGDALMKLKTVKDNRQVTAQARALYKKIYAEVIADLLNKINTGLASRNLDLAQGSLTKLIKYSPSHPQRKDLEEKVQKLEESTPEGRRRLRAALADMLKGVQYFKTGRQAAALSHFNSFLKHKSGTVRTRAAFYIKSIKEFKGILAQGKRALRRGQNDKAITLLNKAKRMDTALGAGNRSRYMGSLARAYYNKGQAAYRRKKYGIAFGYFSRSNGLSNNSAASGGLRRIRAKARVFVKQAKLLKGIDNNEAKRLLRLVMRILPSSHPLHRQARSMR